MTAATWRLFPQKKNGPAASLFEGTALGEMAEGARARPPVSSCLLICGQSPAERGLRQRDTIRELARLFDDVGSVPHGSMLDLQAFEITENRVINDLLTSKQEWPAKGHSIRFAEGRFEATCPRVRLGSHSDLAREMARAGQNSTLLRHSMSALPVGHVLYQVRVWEETEATGRQGSRVDICHGVITIVDLLQFEVLSKSGGATAEMISSFSKGNLSLSALSGCLMSIWEGRPPSFRESPLTRVLQSDLQGGGALFACGHLPNSLTRNCCQWIDNHRGEPTATSLSSTRSGRGGYPEHHPDPSARPPHSPTPTSTSPPARRLPRPASPPRRPASGAAAADSRKDEEYPLDLLLPPGVCPPEGPGEAIRSSLEGGSCRILVFGMECTKQKGFLQDVVKGLGEALPQGGWEASLKATELYMGKFNDLQLVRSKWDANSVKLGFTKFGPSQQGWTELKGAEIRRADSVEKLGKLVEKVYLNCSVGAHNLCCCSSRAFTSCQVVVTASGGEVFRLSLTFLPVSERSEQTGCTETMLQESIEINKALSAFSKCLQARLKGGPIPFRDHKLTQLLQGEITGTAFTFGSLRSCLAL